MQAVYATPAPAMMEPAAYGVGYSPSYNGATMQMPAPVSPQQIQGYSPSYNGSPTQMQTPTSPASSPMIMDDGSAAPFLHQYFQLLAAHFSLPTVSPMATKALNGKLFPLIVDAFKRHDKDGDHLLNKQEAEVLFSHIVSERVGFFSTLTGLLVKNNYDRAQVSEMVSNYKKNKPAIDAKAFKVLLDGDQDGYLQMHQVITALSLDTKKHREFMRAFGFDGDLVEDDGFYYADDYK